MVVAPWARLACFIGEITFHTSVFGSYSSTELKKIASTYHHTKSQTYNFQKYDTGAMILSNVGHKTFLTLDSSFHQILPMHTFCRQSPPLLLHFSDPLDLLLAPNILSTGRTSRLCLVYWTDDTFRSWIEFKKLWIMQMVDRKLTNCMIWRNAVC